MKTLLSMAALLISTTAFAQIPAGNYSGYVSNNPFQEICQLNRGTIDFQDLGNGQYNVFWLEEGFARAPGMGFCENRFDAVFTPSGRANEWDVRFNFNWDMSFGKAVLVGNTLTITANYTGSNRNFLRFNTRMTFNGTQMNYNRTIDRWSGPSLYANGTFYQ